MRSALIAGCLLLAAGCSASRPDIIQVGPWFPKKSASEVPVLSSREEIAKPWGAIAIIHSGRFPSENKKALQRQRALARKMAADAGADGVVVVEETAMVDPQLGVYQPPESFISALAFKYVADVSTTTK